MNRRQKEGKKCKNAQLVLAKVKTLTLGKWHNSEYHKEAWKSFEKALEGRSIFFMSGKILLHWSYEAMG